MMKFVWIIPILSLISFLLTFAIGKKMKEKSAYIAIFFMSISFVLSLLVMFETFSGEVFKYEISWLTYGSTALTLGVWVNPLNALMLVIVTFISLAVFIYSRSYMRNEANFHRYYAYLSLFSFAMLGLVLSPNLLQMYIFWELVGLGSFLLIGFYSHKDSAKRAAKKAFIMTRIGDVALLIGIVYLFAKVGTLDIEQIFQSVQNGVMTETSITIAAILIFIGAMGKSGQFPLHAWLPDAMEGPTPVSALIHAATMVAAGVYLVAVMYPLFEASNTALMVVATVGGITALFGASVALVQKDIKKILAYSTISQLGFMMLALGTLGYVAGIFHLTTHAFFKALLFLAAGAVIHATKTQNIFEMGGLWKKMRLTGVLFLIGAMAIVGVPLLSGFFSKDAILASVWGNGNYLLFVIALIAVFMTGFYIFRMFFVVFFGEPSEKMKDVKEASVFKLVPMFALGLMAIVSGYISTHLFGDFLGDWLLEFNPYLQYEQASDSYWIMIVATLISALGIYIAFEMYGNEKEVIVSKAFPEGSARDRFLSVSEQLGKKTKQEGLIYNTLYKGYYIDNFYTVVIVPGTNAVASAVAFIDLIILKIINGSVIGITKFLSKLITNMQNGQIQAYVMVAFVVMVLIILVIAKQGGFL